MLQKIRYDTRRSNPGSGRGRGTLSTQSNIDEHERETSILMFIAREEEEPDEEAAMHRCRARQGSKSPSAPTAKAARTAAAAAGLSSFFGHRRGGGSANAQSTGAEAPNSVNSLSSEQEFSYLNGTQVASQTTDKAAYPMHGCAS